MTVCSIVHPSGTLVTESTRRLVSGFPGSFSSAKMDPTLSPMAARVMRTIRMMPSSFYGGTGAHLGRGCPLRHAEHREEVDPKEGVTRDGKMNGQVEHPGHGPDQDTESSGCVEALVVLEMSANRERHGLSLEPV